MKHTIDKKIAITAGQVTPSITAIIYLVAAKLRELSKMPLKTCKYAVQRSIGGAGGEIQWLVEYKAPQVSLERFAKRWAKAYWERQTYAITLPIPQTSEDIINSYNN